MKAQNQDKPLYYAFYGTLRKGMDNYELYKGDLTFIKTMRLHGFKMFSLHDYPYVLHTCDDRDTIVAELFTIDNSETEQSIHQMEIDAGYIFLKQDIAEGKMGIYAFNSSGGFDPPVADGDWVKHRRTLGF